MRKGTIIAIIFVLLFLTAAAGAGYVYYVNRNQKGFLKGTTLNGEDVAEVTAAPADEVTAVPAEAE